MSQFDDVNDVRIPSYSSRAKLRTVPKGTNGKGVSSLCEKPRRSAVPGRGAGRAAESFSGIFGGDACAPDFLDFLDFAAGMTKCAGMCQEMDREMDRDDLERGSDSAAPPSAVLCSSVIIPHTAEEAIEMFRVYDNAVQHAEIRTRENHQDYAILRRMTGAKADYMVQAWPLAQEVRALLIDCGGRWIKVFQTFAPRGGRY